MTILFMFSLLWIFSKIVSYTYFQVNILNSGNLFLITDDFIFQQDKNTNQIHYIFAIDNTDNEQFLNKISFAQFSSNDGGYIVCRYKNTIYTLYDEINKINTVSNEKITNCYCKIIPYKQNSNNGNAIFVIAFINSDNKFNLLVYEINIQWYSCQIIKEIESDNEYVKDAISCDFMNSNKGINNEILVCFLSELNTNNLVTISFDPENDYKEEILSKIQKSTTIEIIKSAVSPDKKISLVCYISSDYSYKCSLFNSEINCWSNEKTILNYCQKYNYETNVNYINDTSEYIIYFYSNNTQLHFFILDENFKIKSKNQQDNTCYISKVINKCENKFASSIFFSKSSSSSSNYTLMAKCKNSNSNEDYILDIEGECVPVIESEDLEILTPISTFLEQTTTSINSLTNTLTTFPIISILTTIPSILSSISSFPSSTELSQDFPYSSLLNSLSISSSLISSNIFNYIDFYDEGDIIKGKINITKKEVENNLKQIIDKLQLNQKYKIYGIDYNLTISPIKYIIFLIQHILNFMNVKRY